MQVKGQSAFRLNWKVITLLVSLLCVFIEEAKGMLTCQYEVLADTSVDDNYRVADSYGISQSACEQLCTDRPGCSFAVYLDTTCNLYDEKLLTPQSDPGWTYMKKLSCSSDATTQVATTTTSITAEPTTTTLLPTTTTQPPTTTTAQPPTTTTTTATSTTTTTTTAPATTTTLTSTSTTSSDKTTQVATTTTSTTAEPTTTTLLPTTTTQPPTTTTAQPPTTTTTVTSTTTTASAPAATTASTSTASSDECRGSGLGYHVPLRGVCDAYVQCGSGTTVSSCSAGKYFNGQRCEDCHLVNCQYDPCRGQADGSRFADRQTCNGFYTCWSGRSVYDRCPSGQRFANGRCLYDGTCNGGHPYPNIGSCDGYNYIASPEYPGVFFQLDAGGVYRKRPCPAGLVFDTSVCVCNYPDDYYAKKRVPGFH